VLAELVGAGCSPRTRAAISTPSAAEEWASALVAVLGLALDDAHVLEADR
jgi:hypothetical protein